MLLSPPKDVSQKSYANKSVIVLAAKLDGVNLFENAEMGAESPSTGKGDTFKTSDRFGLVNSHTTCLAVVANLKLWPFLTEKAEFLKMA